MTNDLLEREEGLPIPEEGTAQPEGMNARQPDDSPQGEGPSKEAARMETSQLPQEESSPEEEKAQPEISGGPKTSEAPQEGESAPEAQEEKTVFAPSVWEQRSARKAQAQTRQEEAQARRAQQEGVKSLYSALVQSVFPLDYGDAFKDKNTGLTYRVTSNPDEKKAPKSSTFDLKYFTVERWSLPQ